jgi:hypothetical protein
LYFLCNKKQQQRLFSLENILRNLEKSNNMNTSLVLATRKSKLQIVELYYGFIYKIVLFNITDPVSIKYVLDLNKDSILIDKYEIEELV